MKRRIKEITAYFAIVLMACLLAINYRLFIVPNNFAPAGLNGIATMIQYKTGFSISYMSLVYWQKVHIRVMRRQSYYVL